MIISLISIKINWPKSRLSTNSTSGFAVFIL